MTTYDLVTQFKGVTVWKFSQSKGEIYLRIRHGICDALCTCWINYHAYNDSLVNHLRQSGLVCRDILNHMIFLHDSFKNRTPVTKSYGCYAYIAFGVKDFALKRDRFHVVAVWLGGANYIKGDVSFFEPNYGEFWFACKQDFFGFFPAYFQLRRAKSAISAFLPEGKKAECWLVSTFALSNRAL
ncbi:hypothetical protein [Endozoicomonas euniceicola]|uniref:Uncharacterized protein n=1 Tax=Endozoicomonas euniceicola TaxID=1234143 RepID=A0ABY6GYX3_9GAMM|nr:hypothetical protein [Endozoicomonas euniceicola]UYM17997.1 hypothetical protein NX720_08860 [Endozoicomonas euniceicola]